MRKSELDALMRMSQGGVLGHFIRREAGIDPDAPARKIILGPECARAFSNSIQLSGRWIEPGILELAPFFPVHSPDGLTVEIIVDGGIEVVPTHDFVDMVLGQIEMNYTTDRGRIVSAMIRANKRYETVFVSDMDSVIASPVHRDGPRHSWRHPLTGAEVGINGEYASLVYPPDRTPGCKYDNKLRVFYSQYDDGEVMLKGISNEETKRYALIHSDIRQHFSYMQGLGYTPDRRILTRKRLTPITSEVFQRKCFLVPRLPFYNSYTLGTAKGPTYVTGKNGSGGYNTGYVFELKGGEEWPT